MNFYRSTALWAVGDQVFVSACNFISTLAVARYLSIEGFSTYGLAITATWFVCALHRSYLTQPMSMLGVVESKQDLADRFTGVLLLQVLAWPLVLAMLLLMGWRYFPNIWVSVACFCLMAMFLLQETVRRLFFTINRIREASTMDLVAYGGQLGLLVLVGSSGGLTVVTALFLMASSFAASFFVGVLLLPPGYFPRTFLGEGKFWALARGHWAYSRWVSLGQVFMFASYLFLPFQIAEFGNALWVAQYNSAFSMLSVLNIIRQTIGSYLPTIASRRFHDEGLAGLEKLLNRVAMQMLVAAFGVLFLLIVAGGWLVKFLYGDRYGAVADILPIASIGPLIGVLSFVSQAGATVLERTEDIFYSYLGATVWAFLAAPVLIPKFGLVGAIWVANFGIILPTVWHWVSFKRHCRELRVLG